MGLKSHSAYIVRIYSTFVMVFLLCGVDISSGAKFLLPATNIFNVPSHYMGLTTITKALVDRGHDVTLLIIDKRDKTGILPGSYTANITYPNPKTREDMVHYAALKDSILTSFFNQTLLEMLLWDPRPKRLQDLQYFGCSELFSNSNVLERLRLERFDMILTHPVMDFCDALIGAFLEVPYVVISGTRRTPLYHEGIHGMPLPISYVPFSFLIWAHTDRMDFFQRVQNAIFRYGVHPLMEYVLMYRPIGQLQALHDIRKDLTPRQIVRQADLWLCHHTWALEYPHPSVPNWVPIAGYTIKDAKPLPEYLETFVQGSGEHGFIVFTMGSVAASFSSEILTDMFAKVFSELPQRVLWRYKGAPSRFLGNNTLISDWLPQNDLLAHPKVRMLIYHAGSAGLHEAIHHAVPLLLVPLGGDQPNNAQLAAAKGIARVLDPNHIHEDLLRESIQSVLHNSSYKECVTRASAILRNRIVSPLDTAIFWIEHVVKFGSDHLRVRATEMGFIELHSLDVLAFLVAILLACAYVTYRTIRTCCSYIFPWESLKHKID